MFFLLLLACVCAVVSAAQAAHPSLACGPSCACTSSCTSSVKCTTCASAWSSCSRSLVRCAVECLRLQGCSCTRASLAGDLEDVVCACVWPVFCWFCQLRVFGARGLKHMPDPALLWSALSVTYLIAVIVAFGAVIVLPELAAELLRIVCADE